MYSEIKQIQSPSLKSITSNIQLAHYILHIWYVNEDVVNTKKKWNIACIDKHDRPTHDKYINQPIQFILPQGKIFHAKHMKYNVHLPIINI